MVLDSPYRSLKSLINDNVERFLKNSFLATLSKSPATAIFSNYLKNSKIKYDLSVNQNKHLLPIIGCSCFFIISDKDEMIPYRRFEKLIKEYRPKGTKCGNYASLNTKLKHGAMREEKMVKRIFEFVKEKFTEINFFSYPLKFNIEYEQRKKNRGINRRDTVNTQMNRRDTVNTQTRGKKDKLKQMKIQDQIIEEEEEVPSSKRI